MKRTDMLKVALCGAVVALFAITFVACGTTDAPARAEGGIVLVAATGEWIAVTDVEDGGSSTNEMTEVEIDGVPAWQFAGEVTTQFEWGFAIMQLEPDEVTTANIGAMEAISFMVLGDGQRYSIRLNTTNVLDHGYFEFSFDTVAGEATRVTVPIGDFWQPAWSNHVTPMGMFRAQERQFVTIFSWQTHESWRPGTFEITLWDVRLHVPEGAVVLADPAMTAAVEAEMEDPGYDYPGDDE